MPIFLLIRDGYSSFAGGVGGVGDRQVLRQIGRWAAGAAFDLHVDRRAGRWGSADRREVRAQHHLHHVPNSGDPLDFWDRKRRRDGGGGLLVAWGEEHRGGFERVRVVLGRLDVASAA